jgi:putative ubiquitin-RnfH superfamily antitoxin RatB of RatAB toxin-antitoxin module
MAPADEALLNVEVVYSPRAGEVERVVLRLPPGSTLQQAIERSGLAEKHPELLQWPAGIWGRVQPGDTPLRERDRVEFYRPLQVDPKEARRQRYKGQGGRRKLSGSSR